MTEKIKLNMWERLIAMSILPKESNFVTLRLIRDLNGKLGPSPKEIEKCGIELREDGKGLSKWIDSEMLADTEIEIHKKEKEVVAKALESLDKDKKLLQDHFTLYEKFVGDYDGKTNTES